MQNDVYRYLQICQTLVGWGATDGVLQIMRLGLFFFFVYGGTYIVYLLHLGDGIDLCAQRQRP